MPDLIDDLRALAAKIEKSREFVLTEEATKTAYILPFISALGYDVFDPTEVSPELNADIGTKKGEKIDYAILSNGKPIMLFECKHHAAPLSSENASQLYRYFSVTDCRVAILTNGLEYRFYTDLDAPNKMDLKPFLIFKLAEISEATVSEIKRFQKDTFNIEELLSVANELKYVREMKAVFAELLRNPSDEFVKFCTKSVDGPNLTANTRERFKQLVRKSFGEFINDQIGEKLKTALRSTEVPVTAEAEAQPETAKDDRIDTTVEEIEAFMVIKSILRPTIDPKRVTYRDQQNYFSVLLDDNNRKPIVRIFFNGRTKSLVLMGANRIDEKLVIADVDSIFEHADRIIEMAKSYLG